MKKEEESKKEELKVFQKVVYNYDHFKLNQQLNSAELCHALKVLKFTPTCKVTMVLKSLQTALVMMAAMCSILWLADVTDAKIKGCFAIAALTIGLAAHLIFVNLSTNDFQHNLDHFEMLAFDLKVSDKLIVLAETINMLNKP